MALPIARFSGLTYSNHDIHPVPIPDPENGYSADVFVNGLPAHTTGNTCIPHTIPVVPPPPPHAIRDTDNNITTVSRNTILILI